MFLLPHAQCTLIICYRMRSVRLQFATVCAMNAYYLSTMRSVCFQFVNICCECVELNQVKTYGKSEKSKKKLTQRQKSLSAYTAPVRIR
jgi:hypothetical protein